MIKVIVLGKLKERYLEELTRDYLKRIGKYHKIELIELKDLEDIDKESESILKHISSRDYVITMEVDGDRLDSLGFAKVIDDTFNHYGVITFVVGSSNGLSDIVKSRSNYKISFGNITYPHGLFRGMLLEQIYRAFKINNNETYHK